MHAYTQKYVCTLCGLYYIFSYYINQPIIHLIFILGTICHDNDALRDVFVLSPYLLNSLN